MLLYMRVLHQTGSSEYRGPTSVPQTTAVIV